MIRQVSSQKGQGIECLCFPVSSTAKLLYDAAVHLLRLAMTAVVVIMQSLRAAAAAAVRTWVGNMIRYHTPWTDLKSLIDYDYLHSHTKTSVSADNQQ